MTARHDLPYLLNRRSLVGRGLGAGVAAAAALGAPRLGLAGLRQDADTNRAIDTAEWNPEAIRQRAGTLEVDTAAEVAKIVPLDHAGAVSYWDVGPTQASPELDRQLYDEFWQSFAATYPNIEVERQNLDYNGMIDKARTAAEGGAAPCVARMTILWVPEFSARGLLKPINLADFGLSEDLFWDGALKSVTWDGQLYGIPANNETMALIWNKQLFADAGLDPETPPATWEDVVAYSDQIKQETGVNGYGLVARVNAGNTPDRFRPVAWAYGGGALDEAEPNPTYDKILINTDGTKQALQLYHDMYVRDRSVPTSALTNTQTENSDPFLAGQLAMMISHPSEYASLVDRAATATGADKERADQVVANTAYGLIPEGPVRRAVVFGGWSVHMFSDEVTGGACDEQAARALMAFRTSPEWSLKSTWTGSNPADLRGFETTWMQQRLETIKFLDVTTSMLPYGIPYPVIPEAAEIMNIIVPEMIQNVLTQSMTVDEAADDAAVKIAALIDTR